MVLTRRLLTNVLAAAMAAGARPSLGQTVAPMLPVAPAALVPPAPFDPILQLQQFRDALPPAQQRARQAVERTLERLDDLAPTLGEGRTILVNIAAAEAIAYDTGREVLRSKVIVGTSRTRTPQLTTFVTSVRCNPPWYVPASIAPEILANGTDGFRLVNGRLIQPPGPRNPLGLLRIGLESSDGIFLHGTSNPGLFRRTSRTLSHGCVRVERVNDLASWILDLPEQELRATIAAGRTTDLLPGQEVQVAVAYLTAWPGPDGRVVVYPDPYGLDQPGSRRASFRRVSRPLVPETVSATEDNPL